MNSRVLVLAIFGNLDDLQLMLGGLCRWVDVLELFRMVDELFERASFQMAHTQLRRLLNLFLFC